MSKLLNTLELEYVPCCVCGSHQGRVVAEGRDFEYNSCSNKFTFKECDNCGHWYLSPRPKEHDLGIIYPSNYYSYSQDQWKKKTLTNSIWEILEKRKIKKIVKRFIKQPEKMHLFELGCGSGRFLHLLRKYVSKSCKISAVEISESAVRFAAQIEDVDVIQGNFEEISIEPESIDIIIAQQLIEHVSDPRSILKKAYDSLRPNGVVILETPNVKGFDRKLFSKRYWGGYHFPRHFNLFSPDTLLRLCKQCGFTQVYYEPLISASFWITTMRNILSERSLFRGILPWVYFKNPLLLSLTTSIEISLRIANIPSSNMQFIAKK